MTRAARRRSPCTRWPATATGEVVGARARGSSATGARPRRALRHRAPTPAPLDDIVAAVREMLQPGVLVGSHGGVGRRRRRGGRGGAGAQRPRRAASRRARRRPTPVRLEAVPVGRGRRGAGACPTTPDEPARRSCCSPTRTRSPSTRSSTASPTERPALTVARRAWRRRPAARAATGSCSTAPSTTTAPSACCCRPGVARTAVVSARAAGPIGEPMVVTRAERQPASRSWPASRPSPGCCGWSRPLEPDDRALAARGPAPRPGRRRAQGRLRAAATSSSATCSAPSASARPWPSATRSRSAPPCSSRCATPTSADDDLRDAARRPATPPARCSSPATAAAPTCSARPHHDAELVAAAAHGATAGHVLRRRDRPDRRPRVRSTASPPRAAVRLKPATDARDPCSRLPPEEVACDVGDLDLVGAGVDLQHLGVAGRAARPGTRPCSRCRRRAAPPRARPPSRPGRSRASSPTPRRGSARLAGRRHLDVAEHEVLDVHAGDLHLGELVSWISWNSPMGWPNCTRSLAYCDAELEALLDDPERHRRDAGALHR